MENTAYNPAGPANNAQDRPNQRPSQYHSTDHSAAMDGEEIEDTYFAPDDGNNPDEGETISFNMQNYSHQRGNGFATSRITF